MPNILPDQVYAAMLAAADAAGASAVRVRTSYARANLVAGTLPLRVIRPGASPALLRCDPPPCVRLMVVADEDLAADWEVGS